jgi:Methyltransferase domain
MEQIFAYTGGFEHVEAQFLAARIGSYSCTARLIKSAQPLQLHYWEPKTMRRPNISRSTKMQHDQISNRTLGSQIPNSNTRIIKPRREAMSNQINATKALEEKVGAFAWQVFQSILGAQQCQAAWLGSHLGWYDCLANKGPLSPLKLAMETESSERYAREWCEHQTVCGWISCVDPTSDDREYFLSPAQQQVLTNIDSLAFLLPAVKMVAGLGQFIGNMKDAYKNDTGISWAELGADARDNMADHNRATFLQLLGKVFIPQGMPSLHNKLLEHGGRIADIGAGCAWSSIGVAQAYPKVTVDSFDLDKLSSDKAILNICAEGVQDRVTVHCADAGYLDADTEPYDLVMALQCVHDFSDPVAVLRTMKKLTGDVGSVLIMEEKVQDKFTGETSNDLEKLNYGFSLICCLADCKSQPHSAETGTCMRPSKLEWYAIEAGFRKLKTLPIEHPSRVFYTLLS